MCIACRKRNLKEFLIRIVKEKSGRIFLDYSKKAQGRGAYLCCNENCYEVLKKKKGLEKNFKCKVGEEIYFNLKDEILNNNCKEV